MAEEYKKHKTSELEFLHFQHLRGIKLDQSKIDILVKNKYIVLPKKKAVPGQRKNFRDINKSIVDNAKTKADDYVDILPEGEIPEIFIGENGRHVILDDETYDTFQNTSRFSYSTKHPIEKKDWMPKSVIDHDIHFVNWVNSINSGFQKMSEYEPFRKYCQQARVWLEERGNMADIEHSERREYAREEFRRCQDNTLYFMDKYLQLKEGDMENGLRSYASKPVHKVICFLVDCGYSLMMGKPRQIAATSTIGGIALKKVIFNKNFFLKFITQDKETGVEIFEDKIKYPFNELPSWMKPEVSNDRDNLFRLSRKTASKGTKSGVQSKIQVVAPSVSAINGGSPQLVLVDEAGYINILGKMMREARPTMFMQDPITGKIVMKRQIVVWGTGGEMDKGGKDYEIEFHAALSKWQNKEFTNGIVPLFFDWTTRPGITKEHYNSERTAYLSGDADKEKSGMIQFRQHYPTTLEDMFLTSSKLLVDIEWINKQRERIAEVHETIKPRRGYFEPVYDTSKPTGEHSDIPFEIIGATFVPLDDSIASESRVVVEIFLDPAPSWKNRFYQGTDPVMTDNGFSNMASVIWDARFNTPAAILDYRIADYKQVFLQTMLLGIYYRSNGEKSAKELLEINIGTAYAEYREDRGFGRDLVHRAELPEYLRGGNSMIGIDNRASRSKMIVNKMYEVFSVHGENFCLDKPFEQIRNFVCKITDNGRETWETKDRKVFKDDVLFALVFAYICALAYEHKPPYNLEDQEREVKKYKYPLVRDKNGELTRVKQRA
jgi:hypothetical protein